MDAIGKSPVAFPVLILGKLTFICCWLFFVVKNLGVEMIYDSTITRIAGVIMIVVGISILTLGITNLGKSVSVGLSREKTELKTHGIFRLTRNPIYLGCLIACAGSCLLAMHIINIVLFAITLIVHHSIILKEEEFLEKRFGEKWLEYKLAVPRYIRLAIR